ncbi:MAG: HalOD1 output domain-containing protein [Haloarculaceae archaeon]
MCTTVSVAVDRSTTDRVTAAIVDAMAAIENSDPLDLDVRLGEHVDADALDAAFAHANDHDTALDVSLRVADYDVTVETPGEVQLTKRCDDPSTCEPEPPAHHT